MDDDKKFVTYEDFGAIGNGIADDIDAIVATHDYANEHNLPVKSRPDATYYIGRCDKTAFIETDTDWNTSRFTIDDTDLVNIKNWCFIVRSKLPSESIQISTLSKDQHSLDIHPQNDCFVTVINDNKKVFIRYGLNQNDGVSASDCFILKRDGSIYGPIDRDYDVITRVKTSPVDDAPLTVHGGFFTTIANRADSHYNYHHRGISINRSRVTVDSVVHYVCGETDHGAPYRGFICADHCAYLTVQNCFSTGHKIYYTIGNAGLPVMMGSYDLHANSVIDARFINCRINGITDSTRWGVFASNFCKNLSLENCFLSRLDAHMGVSGTYSVKNSELGWQGLNAIGHGKLSIENSVLYGNEVVSFRPDYGSTWDGTVEIRNCRWIPSAGAKCYPVLFFVGNNGMHDFGYTCSMPREITIDGLTVVDTNTPDDYSGPVIFTDADCSGPCDSDKLPDNRPYPYVPVQRVDINNITCISGKPISISTNKAPFVDTEIRVNGEIIK